MNAMAPLGWLGIIRLGMVQAALGSVVVLITSTLNRVMVVEYALPAVLPGMLVALHYAVQLIRPRFGHGSDRGGRCTPWILGGMAALSIGGVLCALATVEISRHPLGGLALAIVAYALVGAGVGSAGTSLLVLLAKHVEDRRRAPAATIMWVLMIVGFAVTSTTAGHYLDPFSARRLIVVMAVAAAAAFSVAAVSVYGVETPGRSSRERSASLRRPWHLLSAAFSARSWSIRSAISSGRRLRRSRSYSWSRRRYSWSRPSWPRNSIYTSTAA